jgi:hypothetical protein
MENNFSEMFISVKGLNKFLYTKCAVNIEPWFINLNKRPR